MEQTTSGVPRSSTEEAAALSAYYRNRGDRALDTDDRILRDTLERFDASDMISIVDQIDEAGGAPLRILLYRIWLDLRGNRADSAFAIWYNLGVQYGSLAATDNAIVAYKNALALRPDLYQAALNLGTAYEAAGQTDMALATWQKALQPDEARIAILNNRGRVLESLKQLDKAAAEYTTSLMTVPDQPAVLHHRIGLRTRMCTWPIYDDSLPGVSRADLVAATRALTLLATFDDIALQDKGNASWIAEKMPPAPVRLSPIGGYGHAKIRVGYLSSDYCMHPIAYLVAELFELHDRERFEIYGYCSTKDDGSEVRQRVLAAFDTYVDIRALSDEQAARRIREDEIDILVDLNGLTLGTRLPVLRWKPAPVQMTYLGYNGPVPLPELDYIIADDFVIPRAKAAAYRPMPLYMPKCYQVNDRKLPIAQGQTRADAGLPEDAFVFCCFSNTYKITEDVFDAWIKILGRAPRTVLWLFVDNPYAMQTLKDRAVRSGIAAERLIFAGRVEASQYRARLALADLFLDTFPYNAGTTASDALRVGLPLITVSGESFIARMAGSLLTAMGLEDGIVATHAEYIDLAVALATDAARYKAFRDRITPDVFARTIGDTGEFCRDLETAFSTVVVDRRKVPLEAPKAARVAGQRSRRAAARR